MKKFGNMLLGLALVTGMSACVDVSSPRRVLSSAYSAVKDGKIDDLRKTLTGEALLMYGTPEGMAQLKAKVEPMSAVEIGREVVLSDRNGKREYEVDVLGKSNGVISNLFVTNVNCDYWTEYHPGSCNTYCSGGRHSGGGCHTTCNPGYTQEVESCRIAKIR